MFFAISPILQMMPNLTPKCCPNGFQNRSKIDWKSIRKPMHNFNASWHRFLLDFEMFWAPRRASKSIPNRPKIDLGRSWRSQGRPWPTQDPPKTLPRPSQDRKSTPNPPQNDPKSTQNRQKTYPASTQLVCEISKQKVLKIKPLSTKISSVQGYKRARIKRYTEIRTYLLNCSPEFANACQERSLWHRFCMITLVLTKSVYDIYIYIYMCVFKKNCVMILW